MNTEKEMASIAGGLTTVELVPDIIKNEIGNWGVGYKEIFNTQLGESLKNAVDFIQEIAPSVATLGIVWLGLKTIFKGFESDNKIKS